jgi:hypothetical protein
MSVEIGRLVIEIPGLTPEQGRDLAERVGAALARGYASAAGAGQGRAADRVALTVAPSSDLDVLAARIVAGVRGALN